MRTLRRNMKASLGYNEKEKIDEYNKQAVCKDGMDMWVLQKEGKMETKNKQ